MLHGFGASLNTWEPWAPDLVRALSGRPLAFDTLTAWDGARFREARARRGQVFGEPVLLVDSANRFWVAHLGYDADGDETFLDIRDPSELRLVGRAWLGFRIPLGFHGHFVPEAARPTSLSR
jgi:carotenoid cleavage dioxygenase-like enzyme